MIKVRIIKNWDKPEMLRQTPNSIGIWNDIRFFLYPSETYEYDYVIVLNYSLSYEKIRCPRENVWCVLQEPPNEIFSARHQAHSIYNRVFTQNSHLIGKRYVQSQPALPWLINKSYDEFKKCRYPRKIKLLSCVTSNKTNFCGHKKRLIFLEALQGKVNFDLFGYGFHPIPDKWDGLASYKYSIVCENFVSPHYWTEKLADCFLSRTMPIYYGAPNITDYFPKEAIVKIDIEDPDVSAKIKAIINSNLYEKNKSAIEKSCNLVLEKYQFFPYFSDFIHRWEKKFRLKSKKNVSIPNENTKIANIKYSIKSRLNKFLYSGK
jgi:hypothetical protein